MAHDTNGKRVAVRYPRLGQLATDVVNLDQPDRDKPPKASTIPAFLKNWTGWKRDG